MQCASIDAASTVFGTVCFILKALALCLIWPLKSFGLSMCASMVLARRCQFWFRGFCPWWCKTGSTVVGINMKLVGHDLSWRRVVFKIANTSHLKKFNIWCKTCYSDIQSVSLTQHCFLLQQPPVSLQHELSHFYINVFSRTCLCLSWSSAN